MKDYTRNILNTIRENRIVKTNLPPINESKMLTEEAASSGDNFPITKNTQQFGDIRVSMEEALKKTIGDAIELDKNALVYYPKEKDLVLSGKISSLNLTFQFRYNDPSGTGIYIWVSALNLTDENYRSVGKISDAFKNWKQSLIENGDIMERLEKFTKND